MDSKLIKDFKYIMKILKIIPIIMAISQFIVIILLYFSINAVELNILFGASMGCLIFFYLASFVFRFCYYHRVPLYYIFTSLMLCLYDAYIGLPINTSWLFVIHIALFMAMIIQLINFYLK